MLILSRHIDEVIRIGDDVKITIIAVRGDKVRLGIDAPRAVPVHRAEVYRKIQETEVGPDQRDPMMPPQT